MMRTCKIHKIKYAYCCGICDYEYAYISRAHLLSSFREGFAHGREGHPCTRLHPNMQRQAAYVDGHERGRRYWVIHQQPPA